MQSAKHNLLIASLLGILLSLSNVVLADHLHDSSIDETHCEICVSSSAMADSGDTELCKSTPKTAIRRTETPRFVPLEVFRLHKFQRGPPLLR